MTHLTGIVFVFRHIWAVVLGLLGVLLGSRALLLVLL